MTKPSTYTSRNFYVDQEQDIAVFPVLGERSFAVIPPAHCKRGLHRVELDFTTHTATITPAPEEASP